MSRFTTITLSIFLATLAGCENKSLHDAEEFKPREIHEQIEFHFDRVMVDGVEYLILEKDNNNPHEGFGFMAFRGNVMMEKQDSILAYVRTIHDMQIKIYSRIYDISENQAQEVANEILEFHFQEETPEILQLQKADLESNNLGVDTTTYKRLDSALRDK
jgi:hypothetical protein